MILQTLEMWNPPTSYLRVAPTISNVEDDFRVSPMVVLDLRTGTTGGERALGAADRGVEGALFWRPFRDSTRGGCCMTGLALSLMLGTEERGK